MVDVKARDQMVRAIESYMHEEMTSSEFDDVLEKINDGTSDETVGKIQYLLWGCYDDLSDHCIDDSKELWDYFNRIRLLLKSNVELEYKRIGYRWTLRQYASLACLILFVGGAIQIGLGLHLLILSVLCGLASMLLAGYGNRAEMKRAKSKSALTPFPSMASLLQVRRRVPSFTRLRYVDSIPGSPMRNPHWFERICYRIMWLFLLGPASLLIQAFPEKVVETRIVGNR